MSNTAPLTLKEYIQETMGSDFSGYATVWSKQNKQTQFYQNSKTDKLIEYIETHQERADLYFCISTQMDDIGPHKRGSIDTVDTVFAFVADIDFADEKENDKNYPPDEATALDILSQFDIPPNYIQNSGNGLHALFVLKNPIVCRNRKDRRHAQKLSKAFQRRLVAHFKKHGYEIDFVGDTSRLYRVPDSYNHKCDPPKRVKLLHADYSQRIDIEALAKELLEDEPAKKQTANEPNYQPANHERIQERCGWYNKHTGDGAATSDEPNWFASLSITACCKNGETHAHEYSQKHPDYNRRETQTKFDRASTEAGARTCSSIREDLDGDEYCRACPHFGKVKSPVQLGHCYDPGEEGPIPIGYLDSGNYVFRDQRRSLLLVVSASQLLSFQHQVGMAPTSHWALQFPSKRGLYNTIAAGEALIEACKREGPFDPTTVRGLGLWKDGDLTIKNLGDPIPEEALFTYLCFQKLMGDTNDAIDLDQLHDLLGEFPWRNSQDATLVFGWFIIAIMCGALSWRPHLFLYGPPNSGKTTIHNLAGHILSPMRVTADGQSSEAGIRQKLGANALPVIIDEFETDQSAHKLSAIFRLARSASSAESPVLRGTPEGKVMQFAIKTAFFFSAVNVAGMSPADATRITTIELTAHDNDPETGQRIELAMQQLANKGPAFCTFVAEKVDEVLAAIDAFKLAMPSVDSRHRLSMSTLLAGAFVGLNGEAPTPEQAIKWVSEFKTTITRHAQAHERDDAMECLNYLFAHPIRGDGIGEYPLGHWISTAYHELINGSPNANSLPEAQRILAAHQMRFLLNGETPALLIRNGAPPIDRVFTGTKWSNGAWKQAMGQIPQTFTLKSPVSFPGIQGKHRCVAVPIDLVPDALDNPSKNKNL